MSGLIDDRTADGVKRCASMYEAITKTTFRIGACRVLYECTIIDCNGILSPDRDEYKTYTTILFYPCTNPVSILIQIRVRIPTNNGRWYTKEILNRHFIQTTVIEHDSIGYTIIVMKKMVINGGRVLMLQVYLVH